MSNNVPQNPRPTLVELLQGCGELPYPAGTVNLREIPGGFVNLTPYPVSREMAAVLSYGPKFLFPARMKAIYAVEDLCRLYNTYQVELGIPEPSRMFFAIFREYQTILDDSFSGTTGIVEQELMDVGKQILRFFNSHSDVCIVQSDKGNKTTLMLESEYDRKMENYIQSKLDTSVYKYIGDIGSPSVTAVYQNAEKLFNNLVKRLKKEYTKQRERCGGKDTKPLFPLRLYRALVKRKQYKFPELYGTVKCHKEERPMRPICSTLHWFSRPIQRILTRSLEKLFNERLCLETVKNIDDVAIDLHNLKMRPGYVFVKFDVTDMYGTISKMSLDRMVEDFMTEHNRLAFYKNVCGLTFPLIVQLYRYSMHQSPYLKYRERVYKQERGLPQGACDSAMLANLYMDYRLQYHKEALFTNHRVLYWRKYMDDIILYMPPQHIESFQRKFEEVTKLTLELETEKPLCAHTSNIDTKTSPHNTAPSLSNGPTFKQNLSCTCPILYKPNEHLSHQISYLDYNITRTTSGELLVSLYQKPTSSLRMIHSLSSIIASHKIGAIRLFFRKILDRTSTYYLVHDIDRIREKILCNGYSHLTVETVFISEVCKELERLRSGGTLIPYTVAEKKHRISVLMQYVKNYKIYTPRTIERLRSVATRSAGYRTYSFRSISFSNFMRMAHKYFNIAMPVFSNLDCSSYYRKFFCNSLYKKMEKIVDVGDNTFKVGFVTCRDCGMIFLLSGKTSLEHIYSTELKKKLGDIYLHQERYGHTIPNVVQRIRPVKNVDYAYLNTLYTALYSSIGIRISTSSTLSLLPGFLRCFLRYLSGYGSDVDIGLPIPSIPPIHPSNLQTDKPTLLPLVTLLPVEQPQVTYEPYIRLGEHYQVGVEKKDILRSCGDNTDITANLTGENSSNFDISANSTGGIQPTEDVPMENLPIPKHHPVRVVTSNKRPFSEVVHNASESDIPTKRPSVMPSGFGNADGAVILASSSFGDIGSVVGSAIPSIHPSTCNRKSSVMTDTPHEKEACADKRILVMSNVSGEEGRSTTTDVVGLCSIMVYDSEEEIVENEKKRIATEALYRQLTLEDDEDDEVPSGSGSGDTASANFVLDMESLRAMDETPDIDIPEAQDFWAD